MKKIRLSFLVVLLIAVFTFQCKDEAIPLSDTSTIKYGTSFGFCAGYCHNEINISNDIITYKSTSWQEENPDIICSEFVDTIKLSDLISQINFLKFTQLPKVIGCPDCADGGAEWIEITQDGQTHKVTFEYFNEPSEVALYIGLLRDLLAQKDSCE